jgi:hypothetical protein
MISIVPSAQSISPAYVGSETALRSTSALLFVEGYVLSHFALGYEPPDAGPARFGHLLPDFQMLLGKAQDIGLCSGKLGRDRNLLLSRKVGGRQVSSRPLRHARRELSLMLPHGHAHRPGDGC